MWPTWSAAAEHLHQGPHHIQWSIAVHRDQYPLVEVNPEVQLTSASIGKIFILIAVLEEVASQSISFETTIDLTKIEAVSDSGLLQHLSSKVLTVADLCVFTASVSDNLAANALLELVTSERVQAMSTHLGLNKTFLADKIRDRRGPADPIAPSFASAGELRDVISMIDRDDERITGTALLKKWLSLNTDTSMVASAFGLDPLAHVGRHGGTSLWNKTGTDSHVRADAGVFSKGNVNTSYAVIANWPESVDHADNARNQTFVMSAMRSIGELIKTDARP